MFFGNLMYSMIWIFILESMQLLWLRKCFAAVVLEVCLKYVKNITLESESYSISSLCHTFDVSPIVFQAINKVVALVGAIPDGIVGVLIYFLMVPDKKILLQNLQACGLLQPLDCR